MAGNESHGDAVSPTKNDSKITISPRNKRNENHQHSNRRRFDTRNLLFLPLVLVMVLANLSVPNTLQRTILKKSVVFSDSTVKDSSNLTSNWKENHKKLLKEHLTDGAVKTLLKPPVNRTTATEETETPATQILEKNDTATATAPQISGNKTFTHFYSHIPKTGGYYVSTAIMKVISRSPEYEALNRSQIYRLCNEGVRPATDFYKFREHYRHVQCTMWMSEAKWTDRAQYMYTIIRDPREHVISQYFHCTESKDHISRRKYMPKSLSKWLQAWVDFDAEAKASGDNKTIYRSFPSYKRVTDFRCYDPRSMQSRYARFDRAAGDDRQSLAAKFRVLGDLARMDQSVCVSAIEYAGYVPPACDCTESARLAATATEEDGSVLSIATAKGSSLTYLRNHTSHGVQHHGDSHQTTSEEDRLIAKLVEDDEILYQHARDIFDDHVKRLERQYGISLCQKIEIPKKIASHR